MENIQLLLGGFSTLFTFSNVGAAMMGAVLGPVSYTHLDVYKRQGPGAF